MTSATEHYRIVLHPLLTEKSTLEQERMGTYRFEVAAGANRMEIAEAVEGLFGVEVDFVNTMIRPGKFRRRGLRTYHKPPRKIAVVRLKGDHKIELL